MGIFKSFATSGFGDFSTGALRGIAEQGVADAKKNAVFAEDALIKENAEFAKKEIAFNNMKEINSIITKNPLAFGITGDNPALTADRLTNMAYSEQPSIFEHKNIKDAKIDFAKYLASDLSKPIELSSPYVPSAELFKVEQDVHAANLSAISKMPKTDKLQFNLKKIREDATKPEARTDLETEVVKFTGKAYGILNTFPTTEIGRTNMNASITSIVVANARREFPNDATARANFIETKLVENGIDVLEAVKFQKPVSYRGMIRILDAQGGNIASEISRLTNSLAQAETEEQRVSIQSQINQQLMKQHFMINSYSGSKLYALAGKDADKVGQLGQVTVTPRIDEVEPEKEEQAPGLFRRETKPRRPLKEVLPDFREGEPEDTGIDDDMQARATNETPVARQASFKFNNIDRGYLINQWSRNYQSEGNAKDKRRALNDLMFRSFDLPEDAANDVNVVSSIFDGDNNFSKNQITEILSAIGFIESKYKTKIQAGDGPARSYWQVEPATAKSILTQNINAMKAGKKQFLGPNFEKLFKNKYKNAIGNRTALEYFASLSENQLQNLLLKDGAFAATMAAHKVITRFDPYSEEEEIEV
tara:strand:+ start:626 stop:2401 length:1776 start_codon:yes stop_codon:yes gene_type:complete